MLAVMKQNPWSTALGTIGVLGLVIAAVAYFVGVGMGLGGGGMLDFSRWLGQFAGLSLVGYFLYEAFEWLSIERRRVEAEAQASCRRAIVGLMPRPASSICCGN